MIILLLRLLRQNATYAMFFFKFSSGWQLRQRTNSTEPDNSPLTAAKMEALTQPLPSTPINSKLLAAFPSKKSFKSGLVKQEARRFSKIREDTSSKPVANFFFLSFSLPKKKRLRI